MEETLCTFPHQPLYHTLSPLDICSSRKILTNLYILLFLTMDSIISVAIYIKWTSQSTPTPIWCPSTSSRHLPYYLFIVEVDLFLSYGTNRVREHRKSPPHQTKDLPTPPHKHTTLQHRHNIMNTGNARLL